MVIPGPVFAKEVVLLFGFYFVGGVFFWLGLGGGGCLGVDHSLVQIMMECGFFLSLKSLNY